LRRREKRLQPRETAPSSTLLVDVVLLVEVVASRNQTKFDGATEIGPLMPNTATWD
jgi:hypothetical protein